MSKVQLPQVATSMPDLPPVPVLLQGGVDGKVRGFVIPPAVTTPEPAEPDTAEMPAPERIEAALTAATADVAEHGTNQVLTEALLSVADTAEQIGAPSEPIQGLRDAVAQAAQPERCFPWCNDHETESNNGVTTTAHISAPVRMPTPPGLDEDVQVSAELYYNEALKDPQVEMVVHLRGNCTFLNGAEASTYIGDLRAFADSVSVLLAQAGSPAPGADGAHTSDGCDRLHGQCVHHEDDHGDIIHFGPEHKVRIGDIDNALTYQLVRWSSDTSPTVTFGAAGDYDDLDLPGTDAAIEALSKTLAGLREARAHLVAALGEAPPTTPPKSETAQPTGTDQVTA